VLNVATLVGFITLFGIAVRNGILLVSHYNRLLSEGKTLRDAVFQGSIERLNPILMTALTAALALLPLAMGGGEPGKEIQAPMAIVVLGGLLTSTALNMVVVPVLFLRYGATEKRG
jgi:Cu/Ag efflux pump CusA